jgi:hypothetical protein
MWMLGKQRRGQTPSLDADATKRDLTQIAFGRGWSKNGKEVLAEGISNIKSKLALQHNTYSQKQTKLTSSRNKHDLGVLPRLDAKHYLDQCRGQGLVEDISNETDCQQSNVDKDERNHCSD